MDDPEKLPDRAAERRTETNQEGVIGGKERESFARGAGAVRRRDEGDAERLVKAGLAALGLAEGELVSFRKNDSRKQALGWLLRTGTCVGDRWITARLGMGHRSNLTRAVRRMEGRGDRESRKLMTRMMQCAD